MQLMVANNKKSFNVDSFREAASTSAMDLSTSDDSARPPFPIVVWRFTRPHTIIGSAIAIPALHLLAAPSFAAVMTKRTLVSIAYATLPSLLMNLYITGLNQITDVEIDKINKPDLPIAAGILSQRTATTLVTLSLVLSLWLGVAHPVYGTKGLNATLWASMILGTMYSLPPVRLKRFSMWAAFCIVAVRGAVINAGFFAHAKAAAFGDPTASIVSCMLNDPRCLASTVFFGVFGIVIALMKDVPDVMGDRIANIRTFSVKIGQNGVFQAMRNLLSGLFFAVGANFVRMAYAASTKGLATSRVIAGVSSVIFGLSVQKEAAPVNPEDSKQVYKYYMHLWKLFYLSYLVLPFAR